MFDNEFFANCQVESVSSIGGSRLSSQLPPPLHTPPHLCDHSRSPELYVN